MMPWVAVCGSMSMPASATTPWRTYTCVAPFTTVWTLAGSTNYRYTPLDLLDQVLDANNNKTEMTYDSLGRKMTMTDPDMGSWSYTYDVSGNLIQQVDAKNQTTTFQYDPLNRLMAKTRADGSASYYGYDETFTFGKGQRTSVSHYVNGVQQSYSSFYYDERGRNTDRGYLVAGMSGPRYVAWTYDSADRMTSVRYPSNETVTYTYDQAWHQASACSSLGGCYATNAQYTALDQLLTLTFGNGLSQSWVYATPMQRLDQTYVAAGGIGSIFHRQYRYDDVGNVTWLNDWTVGPNATQTFTYDHRDRLTSVTGPTAAHNDSYSYDAIGNLLSKGGQSYTYGANGNGTGAGPHQVRSKGGWPYTYDANGNLTSHNGRTYTWNGDNLPSRLVIPNIADESYTYDADGERLTRTAGGVTTVYLGGLWEEEIQTGVTRTLYSLQGQVVAQRTSSPNEVIYLHSDHLGSVSAATSANGLLVSKQDFTPWGEIRAGTGISQTSLNFTGQRRDSTGILYYHARYYDPNLGRFLSADSVVPGAANGSMDGTALKPLTVDFHEPGFATGLVGENNQPFWFQMEDQEEVPAPWGPANAQALNRYSYVQNNPLRYTDPTGHVVRWTCWTCGDWFSISSWSNMSKGAAEGACLILGCRVDYKRNMIVGPTEEEALQSSAADLVPIPMVGVGKVFTRAVITDKLMDKLTRLVGKADARKFVTALQKGMARSAHNSSGIKYLSPAKGRYTHELKINSSAQRLLGYINDKGELIFDDLERGGLHHQ